MKLVYDDGKVATIYFPPGRPKNGGTCEFATDKCLDRCPSDVNPNALEKAVYTEFVTKPAVELVQRIHMELLDLNKLVLQWFGWGDCPNKLTEKVAWIILKLKGEGVIQCGFTRNKALWRKLASDRSIRIGLTVENKQDVLDYCEIGLVSVPDYKRGTVQLYSGVQRIEIGTEERVVAHRGPHCGDRWMTTENVPIHEAKAHQIREADCSKCAASSMGCFS